MSNIFILATALSLLLSACQQHKFMKDPVPKIDQDKFVYSDTSQKFKDSGKWWEIYNKTVLNRLVEKSLQNNYTVTRSLAQIKQFQAAYQIKNDQLFPDLSLSASAGRSKNNTESNGKVVSNTSDRYSLSLSSTYNIDLFGKGRAEFSAAEMDLLARIEDHRVILMDTTANIVKLWFQISELKAQVEFLKQTTKDYQANVDFTKNRYRLGLASLSDVLSAQQQLIGSKIKMPVLMGSLKSKMHQIKILMGEYPNSDIDVPALQLGFAIPQLSYGIPSELMQRRPDIRAALLRIKSADYLIAAAIANKYPKFSITASAGTQGDELSKITNSDYSLWNILGNMIIPIIDSDGRQAAVEKQKAALAEKVANFNSILFNAFKEVEEALMQIKLKEEQMDLIKQQVEITKHSLDQYIENYKNGLDSWSDILSAQNKFYDATNSLITSQRELIELHISLIVALGGSWTDGYIKTQIQKQ